MPNTQPQPGRDIDRLIQNLYSLAVEFEWHEFRCEALGELCRWAGAIGAAWLTRSRGNNAGEFSEFPLDAGTSRSQLVNLRFTDEQREMLLRPLPQSLRPTADAGIECGYALHYSHRGGGLSSIVLLFFSGDALPDRDTLHRAVGHTVEAGGLSLHQFIQRDEWLYALGRPNRGTAALVDAKGTVYASSRRFRELVWGSAEGGDFASLPFEMPEAALDGEGAFFHGSLHFRVAQVGNLYQLHARRPLPLDGLSPREQQIARALGNGKTFKSVARQYDIAVSTVANHASRIYRKLGIYRREDLVDLVRRPPAPTPAPAAAAAAAAR